MRQKKFFPLVTTSRKNKQDDSKCAQKFLQTYGGEGCSRGDLSLDALFARNESFEDIVVFENQMPYLYRRGDSVPLYFHLNMAALRLDRILKGGKDRFLEVSELKAGAHLLDGTFGLGSDALIAAYQVGEEGQVTALEASKAIFSLMDFSLSRLKKSGDSLIPRLLQRIILKEAHFESFVRSFEDDFFDLVYLDPMFDKPRLKSSGLNSLRLWAYEAIPTLGTLSEALRVTKEKVIIKEGKADQWWREFESSFSSTLTGKRYQSVRYRIIEKEAK